MSLMKGKKGLIMGVGFLPHAFATALAALGFPSIVAISL